MIAASIRQPASVGRWPHVYEAHASGHSCCRAAPPIPALRHACGSEFYPSRQVTGRRCRNVSWLRTSGSTASGPYFVDDCRSFFLAPPSCSRNCLLAFENLHGERLVVGQSQWSSRNRIWCYVAMALGNIADDRLPRIYLLPQRDHGALVNRTAAPSRMIHSVPVSRRQRMWLLEPVGRRSYMRRRFSRAGTGNLRACEAPHCQMDSVELSKIRGSGGRAYACEMPFLRYRRMPSS